MRFILCGFQTITRPRLLPLIHQYGDNYEFPAMPTHVGSLPLPLVLTRISIGIDRPREYDQLAKLHLGLVPGHDIAVLYNNPESGIARTA